MVVVGVVVVVVRGMSNSGVVEENLHQGHKGAGHPAQRGELVMVLDLGGGGSGGEGNE